MKLAYIISAYKFPSLVVRLVRRLSAPHVTILIHVDSKTDDAVYRAMQEPLRDLPSVQFLARHACNWGDFGHVRATLKGLQALIDSSTPFDYVILLTGQDYPLKSNEQIARTLEAASGKILMQWRPVPNDVWANGLERFEKWHFWIGNRKFAFPPAPFRRRSLNAVLTRMTRALRLRRTFPTGLEPFGGSSYWMMPVDCARFVYEFSRSRRDVVRFFRRVFVPDEMFFHTIVLNSPLRERVAVDDLRYIDWSENGNHPKVLTMEDFGALMQSDKLFARKFDPGIDAEVLDRIEERLNAKR